MYVVVRRKVLSLPDVEKMSVEEKTIIAVFWIPFCVTFVSKITRTNKSEMLHGTKSCKYFDKVMGCLLVKG